MHLPEAYLNRMQQMLGDEYPAFIRSYDAPRLRGLRVNTLKISADEFERIAPFPVERIPWIPNGFFYSDEVWPARHPYYAAGLYYLQEPSAMTPAAVLPVKPGDRVLDLCAAPGGKATELAARLCGEGLLAANDISGSRAKALLRNLELFGVQNMLVTNETPARLADAFPCWFDCILVDAPCSGEGMFRKDQAVADAWSPDRVRFFAAQQREILAQAYRMLRPGGYLLYSTCTFAPEEDEQQIRDFLTARADMRTVDTGLLPAGDEARDDEIRNGAAGFGPGRAGWLDIHTGDWENRHPQAESEEFSENREYMQRALARCVRIWPHRMNGEGHFIALMKKQSGTDEAADAPAYSGFTAYSPANDQEKGAGRSRIRKNRQKTRGGRASGWEKSGRAERNTAGGKDRGGEGRIGEEELMMLLPFAARVPGLCEKELSSGELSAEELPVEALHAGDVSGKGRKESSGSKKAKRIKKTAQAEYSQFRIESRGGRAYMVQDLPESVRGLHFLRSGLYLGEWKKNRFEPSQPLAMAQRLLLSDVEESVPAFRAAADDGRLTVFLQGGPVPLTEEEARGLADGWVLVCADRYSLGWGKKAGMQIKNKYPASWR